MVTGLPPARHLVHRPSIGPIEPGKSITVTLATEGTFLIECAFHYKEGMQDVLIVKANQKPGPQGTPMPKATASSTPPGGGSGGW